jgi:hypothetical protein
MPRFVYVDHNFLIDACSASTEERQRKQLRARGADFAFVLSPWSVVEVARARASAWEELAWYAESLTPVWLPERRRLQQHEVEERFFFHLGIPYSRPNTFRALGEVVAELTRTKPMIGKQYTIVELVQAIRSDMGPITRGIGENSEARHTIEKAIKDHRFTESIKAEISRQYIWKLLPSRTPSGILISREGREEFLNRINLDLFPSIAVEFAMSEEALQSGSQLTEQAFMDRQHIIAALPYVDVIVTDDRKLARSVERVAKKLTFHKAQLLTRNAFDALLVDSSP